MRSRLKTARINSPTQMTGRETNGTRQQMNRRMDRPATRPPARVPCSRTWAGRSLPISHSIGPRVNVVMLDEGEDSNPGGWWGPGDY